MSTDQERLEKLLMRDHGCLHHNGKNPEQRPCKTCIRRAALIIEAGWFDNMNEFRDRIRSCPRHPHWSGMVWDCMFCDEAVAAFNKGGSFR